MQVPLGPRKKLLAAISALKEPDRPAGRSQGDIERRHVTALFCDLVASTEYAVRLDPEDFLDLTNRYIERCSSVIRDHNGTVVNVTGDAFLALFGYPTAEEDDADRALRSALDVLRIAPSIEVPEGPPVQVRIGIATGLAVAGRADSGRISASGPIPNLAQRLQTAASPQTILIDQRTYDATAGAFEFTDVGLYALKGFAEPVQVWRVERSRLLRESVCQEDEAVQASRSPSAAAQHRRALGRRGSRSRSNCCPFRRAGHRKIPVGIRSSTASSPIHTFGASVLGGFQQ